MADDLDRGNAASDYYRARILQNFGPQQVTPFTGNFSTYGLAGGEHPFFAPATPGLPAPVGTPPASAVPPAPVVPDPMGGKRPNAPGGMGHLTTKQLIQQLREASRQTGQKLTKSDRQAIRRANPFGVDYNVEATQAIDAVDRGLQWVQDPLGGVLGWFGMENPFGMSNFGATGLAAGLGRAALRPLRRSQANAVVERNRAGTPAERERENWNDRAREALETGRRMGGPV